MPPQWRSPRFASRRTPGSTRTDCGPTPQEVVIAQFQPHSRPVSAHPPPPGTMMPPLPTGRRSPRKGPRGARRSGRALRHPPPRRGGRDVGGAASARSHCRLGPTSGAFEDIWSPRSCRPWSARRGSMASHDGGRLDPHPPPPASHTGLDTGRPASPCPPRPTSRRRPRRALDVRAVPGIRSPSPWCSRGFVDRGVRADATSTSRTRRCGRSDQPRP
jgi:hypothetical protein